jgi:hypothetical protein
MTPRSDDELLDLLEKLARQYARPHNPMESYGPARYQRAPKPAPFTPPKGFTKEGGVYVVP